MADDLDAFLSEGEALANAGEVTALRKWLRDSIDFEMDLEDSEDEGAAAALQRLESVADQVQGRMRHIVQKDVENIPQRATDTTRTNLRNPIKPSVKPLDASHYVAAVESLLTRIARKQVVEDRVRVDEMATLFGYVEFVTRDDILTWDDNAIALKLYDEIRALWERLRYGEQNDWIAWSRGQYKALDWKAEKDIRRWEGGPDDEA